LSLARLYDLDPELCRVYRAVDRDGLPSNDLASRGRGSAMLMVSTSRAVGKVDIREGLDRAERLRQVANLEEWRLGHR
jgi:hypothetical protein